MKINMAFNKDLIIKIKEFERDQKNNINKNFYFIENY